MKLSSQSKETGNINFFIKMLFIREGYTKTSNEDEIKKIYKTICLSYHPDTIETEFKTLSQDIFSGICDMKDLLIKEYYENIGNRRLALSPSVPK